MVFLSGLVNVVYENAALGEVNELCIIGRHRERIVHRTVYGDNYAAVVMACPKCSKNIHMQNLEMGSKAREMLTAWIMRWARSDGCFKQMCLELLNRGDPGRCEATGVYVVGIRILHSAKRLV